MPYEGSPYLWGGSNPETGFDCSGLVQWAYARAGIEVGRSVGAQRRAGTPVRTRAALAPGDLVFLRRKGGPIDEVGIWMRNGRLLIAQPGDVVKVARVDDPAQGWIVAGARRIGRQSR